MALGPIVDPALVPATIAQVLDVRDTGGRPVVESLTVFLRERHLLLVLDNFEQILSAGLTVAELLMAAPNLEVLVTSRAPLQIRGEHELKVAPLPFPVRGEVPSTVAALGQYPAVALFVERGQAVHPAFVVTTENAPAVAPGPSPLDVLDSLSAQSLVLQRQMPDGEPRFGMLETIREYALERLDEAGELDEIRRQHAAYFLALAEEAEPHLRTARQTAWLQRLDPEHDNYRAALAWSRSTADVETGLRIAGALCWFWAFRGHVGEGRSWLADLLSLPGGSPRSRARALLAASTLAIPQADYATVRSLASQSARIFAGLGDRSSVGTALTCVGIADLGDADIASARPVLESAVAVCREAGNC